MKSSLLFTTLLTSVTALTASGGATLPVNSTTNGTDVTSTSTEVVTAYTTFCPGPTSIVEGNNTYVVTEATTLTVTDCPCTRTHTFTTKYVTVCGATGTPSAQPAPAEASSTSSNTEVAASNGASRTASSLTAIGALAALMLFQL